MPDHSLLDLIRTRMHDAEASLVDERARCARLQREVTELETLWRRDAGRVAQLESTHAVHDEQLIQATRRELAEARAQIDALRAECESQRRQTSAAMAVAAWLQARCHHLGASRPIRWWKRLRAWLGRPDPVGDSAGIAADAALLRASGRFDKAWYLATYTDVAAAGLDPIEHYLAFGANEGRNPSPGFDTSAYRAANPQLAATGTNPLLHAIVNGTLQDGGRT